MDNAQQFEPGKIYKFTVSFHVDIIKDLTNFDMFILPAADKVSKRKKGGHKEKMYDVLSFQFKTTRKCLI